MVTDEEVINYIKINGPTRLIDLEKAFPNYDRSQSLPQIRRLWKGGRGILKRKNFYYSVTASLE